MLEDYLWSLAAVTLLAWLLPSGLFALAFAWPALARGRRIQPRRPSRADVRREVLYSLRACLLFALYTLPMLWAWRAGQTALRAEFGAWWQEALGFLAALVLHDSWFYWTHRLMHWPPLFRWVHAGHHRSRTPTPWATLAFDPLETLPQFLFFALLVWLVPMHPLTFLAYLLFDGLVNAAGHCGHEFIPAANARLPLLRWCNAVTHHDLHHSRFSVNYGQYFNLWDRLCGTFEDRPGATPPRR